MNDYEMSCTSLSPTFSSIAQSRTQRRRSTLYLSRPTHAAQSILVQSRIRQQWLFSLFLDLLSGYGYKPLRCFIAYLIVILTFATAYFIIGHTVGPVLSPLGSVVFSMTSFHGRGFFPGGIALDDPLTVVAALKPLSGYSLK